MIAPRPPCVLRYRVAAGSLRYLAGGGYKRFTPTAHLSGARWMEREEAEFWLPLLREWFPSALATLEIFEPEAGE